VKRKGSPVDFVLLLGLCVLGFILGRLQTNSRTAGRVDSISSIAQTLVSPVASPLKSVADGTGDFFYGLFSARRLAIENRRLQALANSAEMYVDQTRRLEQEIDRLRTLQGFGPIPGKERIKASVIHYAAYENRVTLNVGSRHGVGRGMPVEAPEGLVGTIQVVEADRSQALLVTSASLKIGAIDLKRNPPPAGLLRGENSNTLSLTFQDPRAPVEIGDQIVTSGFSDKIPRGIRIGTVIAVENDEEFGSLRARVDWAVNVGMLREVHVLK